MSIIRREKSRIGMYHVLAQSAGHNELFHDEEDYQVFVGGPGGRVPVSQKCKTRILNS